MDDLINIDELLEEAEKPTIVPVLDGTKKVAIKAPKMSVAQPIRVGIMEAQKRIMPYKDKLHKAPAEALANSANATAQAVAACLNASRAQDIPKISVDHANLLIVKSGGYNGELAEACKQLCGVESASKKDLEDAKRRMMEQLTGPTSSPEPAVSQ